MNKQIQSHLFIYSIFLISFFTLSCQRAVDSDQAKISLVLPGSAPVVEGAAITQLISNSLKFSTNISQKNSGESDDGQESESFLNIMPSGYSAVSTYPINCYLIGIAGSESFLKVNACGKKNANNEMDRTYQFGTYIGLRPAGSVFEFEVAPGDDRQIFIFGLHSTNIAACTDLIINRPSKVNFSKPYMLGQSALIKFEAGKSITVPVDLSLPVPANQLDDCEFNNEQESQLIANTMVVENRSHPFNNLRLPITASAYSCEPLDIRFKNITSGNENQGLLAQSISAQINYSGPKLLFNDYADCTNVSLLGDATVAIPAGAFEHRVWARFTSSDPSSADVTVTDPTNHIQQFQTRKFSLADQLLTYAYDGYFPRQMKSDECVPFKVSLLSIYGDEPTSDPPYTASFSLAAVDSSSNTIGSFFSDNTCTTSASNSVTLTTGQFHSGPHYFKLNSTGVSGVTITATPTLLTTVPPLQQYIKVVQPDNSYTPVITQMRLTIKSHFPERKPPSTSTELCMPVKIQMMDQLGFSKITAATDFLTWDTADSNFSDLSLYQNSTCTTSVSAGTSVNFPGGTSTMYLYIRPNYMATLFGEKSLSLVFNNGIKRKVYFTLTNALY